MEWQLRIGHSGSHPSSTETAVDPSGKDKEMKRVLLPLLVLALSCAAFAGSSTTINFEQYAGYTQITNQYAADGVTFQNALQLVAPGYDYLDYPAHSGSGVITNDPNDPIMVSFTNAVQVVSGWYTDPNGITVDAYNIHGQLIGTFDGSAIIGADAQFTLGSTLNGGYISYITISDDTGQPDSETVDDLYFALPEPGALSLIFPGLLGVFAVLRRKPFAPGIRKALTSLGVIALILSVSPVSRAADQREVITQPINNSQLATLTGNTRPDLNVLNDLGRVNPDLQLNHMLLLLQRSPEQEAALEQFIEEQHNPKSPLFHQWIQAAEFGQRFGLAQPDIGKLTQWLEGNGLKVNYVYQNRILIDYSGTASQIENAFHTQLHNYLVNGEVRMANNSDPKIPAALAEAIVGPLYLNNFHPQAMNEKRHGAHISPTAGRRLPAGLHRWRRTAAGGVRSAEDLQHRAVILRRHNWNGHDRYAGGRHQPVELPPQQPGRSRGWWIQRLRCHQRLGRVPEQPRVAPLRQSRVQGEQPGSDRKHQLQCSIDGLWLSPPFRDQL